MNITSIIILNHNLKDITCQCIESIRKYTPAGTYEIIVVDNGSSDGSADYFRAQSDIRLIVNRENRGYPAACNQGLAMARGQDLLLLNNDIVVTVHWLENLRRALYSGPSIGAVGPMTNCSMNLQRVEIPYLNENTPTAMTQMQKFAQKFNVSNPDKWCRWQILTGFCLMFKREVYEKIGDLDENFSPGNYEDNDYCLRIRKAGYEILLCKDTFIHHFGSQSFKVTTAENKAYYDALLMKNRRYFLDKWHLDDSHYQKYGTFVLDITFDHKNARIIEYNSGSRMDLYILAAACPLGEISGTTKNKADLQMGSTFPLYYAEDIQAFMNILEGQYNLIIIPDDLQDITADKISIISNHIKEHLYPKGVVLMVAGGKLFHWQKE